MRSQLLWKKCFTFEIGKLKNLVLKFACLAVLAAMGAGCGGEGSPRQQPVYEPPPELEPVEVNQYQGEQLSSSQAFRENSIKGPQQVNIDDYSLEVSGFVTDSRTFSYDELLERDKFKKVVTLNCVEGWSVTILWEGVLLRDILDEAKPKPEAKTVIFHAYDGYSTSFPLEYFYENDIIMAYKMNNVTLPPERGYPFQLVAESKWGYKWIKWITEIELSDDTDYQGYWESRGYSDTGNLNESFLD